MKKTRLDYLDFAKFIAILLVIWGHASPNGTTPAYRVALYSFHMPLFFLVSGMVISRRRHEYNREHWKNFIFKNLMTLLVPYLIWGAIYSDFSCKNFIKLCYGSWEVLNATKTLTSLWFLPCLFVARILAEFLLMMSWRVRQIPRHLFGFLAAIGAFLLGFLMPLLPMGYPLCFNIALLALGFILLGYAVKDLILHLPKTNPWIYLAAAAACGGILAFGQRIQGAKPFLMLMCQSKYGNPLIFFWNAFAGIGLVFAFSLFLTAIFQNNPGGRARKFMLWAGENTIGIYLLHKPFLQEVVMPAVSAACPGLTIALQGLLGMVVAFLFSLAGCYIINKYVPSLFGKFQRSKEPIPFSK